METFINYEEAEKKIIKKIRKILNNRSMKTTDKEQKKFRKWVKITLAKNDITARQLAEQMGISPQDLNNRLSGRSRGGYDTLELTNQEIRNALNELI